MNFLCMRNLLLNNAWQELVQNTTFYLNHGRQPRAPLSVSRQRGRTLPSKRKKNLLLLLHSTCKPQLRVPKYARSMHSKPEALP